MSGGSTSANDLLDAGGGDDLLDARDSDTGFTDTVGGGEGDDSARVDPDDDRDSIELLLP